MNFFCFRLFFKITELNIFTLYKIILSTVKREMLLENNYKLTAGMCVLMVNTRGTKVMLVVSVMA